MPANTRSLETRSRRRRILASKARISRALRPPYECPKCGGGKSFGKTLLVDVIRSDGVKDHGEAYCMACGLRDEEIPLRFDQNTERVDIYCTLVERVNNAIREARRLVTTAQPVSREEMEIPSATY